MKKNWIMRVALIVMVLTLVTACCLGGTFAKYQSTKKAEDSARVAHWGFTTTTVTLDAFKTSYGDAPYDAQSENGDKIMAPGITGEATITVLSLAGAPEVAYNFSINTNGSTISEDIKNNPNIKWRLDDGEWGTWDALLAGIKAFAGEASGTKHYAPGTSPDIFNETHKVAWTWAFATDIIVEPNAGDWDVKWTDSTEHIVEGVTIAEVKAIIDGLYMPNADDFKVEFNGKTYDTLALAIAAYENLNPEEDNFKVKWNGTNKTYKEADEAYDLITYPTFTIKLGYDDTGAADPDYEFNYFDDAEDAFALITAPDQASYVAGNDYVLLGVKYNVNGADGRVQKTFAEVKAIYDALDPTDSAYDWKVTFNSIDYDGLAEAETAYAALEPVEADFKASWNGSERTFAAAKEAYEAMTEPTFDGIALGYDNTGAANTTHKFQTLAEAQTAYGLIAAPDKDNYEGGTTYTLLGVNYNIGDVAGTTKKTFAEVQDLYDALNPADSAYSWGVTFNSQNYAGITEARSAYTALKPQETNFTATWNGVGGTTYSKAVADYEAMKPTFAGIKLGYNNYGSVDPDYAFKYVANANTAYATFTAPDETTYNAGGNYTLLGNTYNVELPTVATSWSTMKGIYDSYNPEDISHDWSVTFNGAKYSGLAAAETAYTDLEPVEADFTAEWNGGTYTYNEAKTAYAAITKPAKEVKYHFTNPASGNSVYSVDEVVFATYGEAIAKYNTVDWKITEISTIYNGESYSNYSKALDVYNASVAASLAQDAIDTAMGSKEIAELGKVKIVIAMQATQDDTLGG